MSVRKLVLAAWGCGSGAHLNVEELVISLSYWLILVTYPGDRAILHGAARTAGVRCNVAGCRGRISLGCLSFAEGGGRLGLAACDQQFSQHMDIPPQDRQSQVSFETDFAAVTRTLQAVA